MLLCTLASTLLLCTIAVVALVNVTIDDELGDSRSKLVPQYTPDDQWAQGARCSGCALHPGIIDVSKAFEGTWHDSTYHPGEPDRVVTLTFNGVAIYVFNIVPNSVGGATTLTNLSFFLDGAHVSQFRHVPDQTSSIAYRVPVYVNRSLRDTQHTLHIRATGLNASVVLFDYAVYSTMKGGDSDSTSASSSSATRARLIGGVVGGVGGSIALLVMIFTCLRRYHKRREGTQEGADDVSVIEQTQTNGGPIHIAVLPGAADESRPRLYPPHSDSATISSAVRNTAVTRTGEKGGRVPLGTRAGPEDMPVQLPRSTVPSVSGTAQSGPSVQEDLAAIRQEIARLREQRDGQPVGTLPLPYEAEEHT